MWKLNSAALPFLASLSAVMTAGAPTGPASRGLEIDCDLQLRGANTTLQHGLSSRAESLAQVNLIPKGNSAISDFWEDGDGKQDKQSQTVTSGNVMVYTWDQDKLDKAGEGNKSNQKFSWYVHKPVSNGNKRETIWYLECTVEVDYWWRNHKATFFFDPLDGKRVSEGVTDPRYVSVPVDQDFSQDEVSVSCGQAECRIDQLCKEQPFPVDDDSFEPKSRGTDEVD
ncbi:hypothetical protein I316_03636 [Kwoniella heveanensis BCC8398]|uniref:Uncharacterized protein n=1 Tax=Kwoniella heveanensis BCC8398 TaxID=1296120 RepID=A0A1B9GUN6_9TREE|nr:hypothetical protein I316_03636 [Kwoniella heveanensis BCC8398]